MIQKTRFSTNFGFATNAEFLDEMYKQWRQDPDSISPEMRAFFEGFEFASRTALPQLEIHEAGHLQSKVNSLVYHYRSLGHLAAQIDPLEQNTASVPMLELKSFDLSEDDQEQVVDSNHFGDVREVKLSDLIDALKTTYCGPFTVEYMHIQNTEERRWLQQKIEVPRSQPNLSHEEKLKLLKTILKAQKFENYLQTKYLGQKRFSLEGAESLIPCLDTIADDAASTEVKEIVLGMAHRGRLNVLANVLRMPLDMIFAEFEENYVPGSIFGDGDVKYHQGFSSNIELPHGSIHISLAANPSHLEAVCPVVEGKVRAKQSYLVDKQRRKVIPVLIHGEAAFSGQGVVAETLNLSQLEGYRTGGTIHIIVNNQIGFTTSPKDARSTTYASDVAKMIAVPILHVNGDYPEHVVLAAKLALQYRQKFNKDVVIDIVCYRRLGHNEGDEPEFTQPLMYSRIDQHDPVGDMYLRYLLEEKKVPEDQITSQVKTFEKEIHEGLEQAHDMSQKVCIIDNESSMHGKWKGFDRRYRHELVDTGVSYERLAEITRYLNTFPDGFTPHPKIARQLKKRQETMEARGKIDWPFAEMLAFGSLIQEGTLVRLSGQDSRRGTFSQRHAALSDIETGERFIPLTQLRKDRIMFRVYDSMLSEFAVLGFEFGYSLADPHRLVIWEAQFGDFANGAQVVIDQFIVSGSSKWERYSGLVLLLPHGYEGQGPEHSSARLERFLSLCARDNIQVCYPTTPAQYFHLLRRQIHRPFRLPLIIMSPKSMLRNPLAVSSIESLEDGHFRNLLEDPEPPSKPSRLILCSGKIFYELLEKRRELKNRETAIVRVEQFYPFPQEEWEELAEQYKDVDEVLWVQEEPENMGGWNFMSPRLHEIFRRNIVYVGRLAAASPATASLRLHKIEQATVVNNAFQKNVQSFRKNEIIVKNA